MGFNNWARYECDLNQKLFTDTADWMLEHGFLAAGYNTLTVDDCWMTTERDPDTHALVVNTTLFPQGMGWLGQYLHTRGFKFGIYEDAGYMTCGGYPGSQGHYDQDVAQFAAWEVDYIKLDGCYIKRNESLPKSDTLEPTFHYLYRSFGEAIRSQPRPMVYSESAPAYFAGASAGTGTKVGRDWYKVHTWIGRYGQLWRHSTDIAVWHDDGNSRWYSVMTNYNFNMRLARFQRPGNWNDPDFIVTGDNEGLTFEEQRSQFGLWTIMASPLILSTDVKILSTSQIAYLTNPESISINQDPLGIQGRFARLTVDNDVLVKPLANSSQRAVAILNKRSESSNVTIPYARFGYTFKPSDVGCNLLIRELFSQSEVTVTVRNPRQESLSVLLNPHDTALYRITTLTNAPECRVSVPTGIVYLTSSFLCMAFQGGEPSDGVQVVASPCTTVESQLWQISTAPPPFEGQTSTSVPVGVDPAVIFWIKTLDNYCLDLELSTFSPAIGSRIVVNKCDIGRETQQWRYDPIEGTLYHAYSGFCIDAPDASNSIAEFSTDERIQLKLSLCGSQRDTQVWSLPA
ncbi:hypothetical protein BGW38_009018 [Lunasporangiospora selenospora]|uniref:Alpha-galactosidase n=1 Tax=Lunasporangiospora selenospora TaxID=979761 RepID=A0A9P6KG99_9FUNG|nr:hypothetical protein BGW38_009018 [Lunasporangiospora selenospora]